ncbi:MAG: sulfurtransferase TusA family protein [Vampirovibrionales bacterium]
MLPTPVTELDLRHTKCPLNFVQTCLALDKLASGEVLTVLVLAQGPSAQRLPNSLQAEGHRVIHTEQAEDGVERLWVQRHGAGLQAH